eukprot:573895-Amphidinium_carterae.1
MRNALDSQSTQTFDEDPNHDMEGTDVSIDSQSHMTTASYMSDAESCYDDVQHGSDMQVDDAAVST